MSLEAYRVRRKFQWNGFVYAVAGPCECSLNAGSELVSTRITPEGSSTGQFDGNPCKDKAFCNGLAGTECHCNDADYCSCSIKPYMYGGEIWLANEGDPRKEYILQRRFVVYDATLPSVEQLLKDPRYRTLTMGEPVPGVILFPPENEVIVASVPKLTEDQKAREILGDLAPTGDD